MLFCQRPEEQVLFFFFSVLVRDRRCTHEQRRALEREIFHLEGLLRGQVEMRREEADGNTGQARSEHPCEASMVPQCPWATGLGKKQRRLGWTPGMVAWGTVQITQRDSLN